MTIQERTVLEPQKAHAVEAPTGVAHYLAVVGRFAAHQYLAGVVVLVALLLSISEPAVLSAGNLRSVLFQAALTGISACGMTLLIAAGVMDLSVPGVVALSSLTAATLLPRTTVGMAIVAALLVGALAGLVNGVLVSAVKIPFFIATLGTQYLYLGIVFVLTHGGITPISSYYYGQFTNGTLAGLPIVFVALIVFAVLGYVVLYWTHFGRAIRAIGSNERAARLAGLPVGTVKIATFVIGGLLFAVAGVFLSGELSSVSGTMATGAELNAIAAVVVGGTALRGGQATMTGTVVGAVLFSLLSNALNLLGVTSYWQYVLTGVVLAAAVALGVLRRGPAVRGAE